MPTYRNDTKGARTIHLKAGGYVLVEAGATATVAAAKIKRVGPGLVEDKTDELPPVPEDLAEMATAQAEAKKAAKKPATRRNTRGASKKATK